MLKRLLINQIFLGIDEDQNYLKDVVSKKLNVIQSDLKTIKIIRKSIDARKKAAIKFVYSVCAELDVTKYSEIDFSGMADVSDFEEISQDTIECGKEKLHGRVVVIGSGPAGIFAALELAEAGYRPLIVERGDSTELRNKKVEAHWSGGELDTESNVQFGEGGAGAFSDGKLTTRIGDTLCEKVLKTFADAGASKEILISAKPHIGSDVLKRIIPEIRRKIESLGGEFRFRSKLKDIVIKDARLNSVLIKADSIETGAVVLAIGHSARDTFEMLLERGVEILQKPFSVGVRIEHPQELIDKAQYGAFAGHKALGPADYQLFTKGGERTAYTFCMCPGGIVLPSATETDGMVTNGMSLSDRAGVNANSAFVVSVKPSDFKNSHPLAGIEFQRQIEKRAYQLGNGRAPIQRLGDFMKGVKSKSLGVVKSSFPLDTEYAIINELFPEAIVSKMREAVPQFDNKLRGFAFGDALLIGPETRTSSPLKLIRNDDGQAKGITGLYPAGEGAGYAGGIMSAAVDGIKAAQKIIRKYQSTQSTNSTLESSKDKESRV